jgi:hypothetical protein
LKPRKTACAALPANERCPETKAVEPRAQRSVRRLIMPIITTGLFFAQTYQCQAVMNFRECKLQI